MNDLRFLQYPAGLALALIAGPAFAESAEQTPAEAAATDEEIIVSAERLRGVVDAPQPPVATIDEAGITGLGASSLADVLVRLAPQIGSGRGRGSGGPVVLVNGQRVGGFREMRNYPPESIKRIEVLPEEVAQRYGFRPDQRVVNFILKDNFASKVAEIDYGQPDRGGSRSIEGELSMLRIAGPNRFNLTASLDDTSALTEAERGVIQDPGAVRDVTTDPDPAAFRTLIADSREYTLNASWSRGLGKDGLGGQLSLNATLNRSESDSLFGLDAVRLVAPDGSSAVWTLPGPLERATRTTTLSLGSGLNTFLGAWQFSATLDGTHSESRTLTDRRADTTALVAGALAGTVPIAGELPLLAAAGQDLALNNSERVEGLATLSGRPLRMPAGPVSTTFNAGFTWIDFDSLDDRATVGPVSLGRFRVQGGVNVAMPLTSRRERFGAGLGDLTLNLSASVGHVSDFGAVNDWSAGLTWAPVETLNLQASYIANQEIPAVSQLGNPLTQTFNVPVYDFTRGENVLVTIVGGGNPQLQREQQRDIKLAANWTLPIDGGTLLVEWFRNRSDNVTAAFPLLTPAIEAAFPTRVTRDETGRLIAIDSRPVTFAEQRGERLRWGLSFSGNLGKPPGEGGGRPGAGGGGGRPMMGAMMRGGGSRWSLAAYHTVQFEGRVLVAPGGPVLDLLGGDALSTGGTPRHGIEFNGGAFRNGLGLFFQGSWSAPTRVRASGVPDSSDLRFGAVTKFNLNLFASLEQLIKDEPLTKGLRFSVRLENLLDSRQRVTDATGTVPLSYQPDRLDPRGRFIEVELRKLF